MFSLFWIQIKCILKIRDSGSYLERTRSKFLRRKRRKGEGMRHSRSMLPMLRRAIKGRTTLPREKYELACEHKNSYHFGLLKT